MRSKDTCEYPAAAFKFEKVARVFSTVPEAFRTWTFSVSYVFVFEVSAVSMCSQKDRVTYVAVDGIATDCAAESVCGVP